VAPDLGGVGLKQHFADLFDLLIAYIHMEKLGGDSVAVRTYH
jgi:hypothetical protein